MNAKQTLLGARIKQHREANNLKQDQLAEILKERYGMKTNRETISKWESGFHVPTISNLKRVAEVLKVSLDELNGKENGSLPFVTIGAMGGGHAMTRTCSELEGICKMLNEKGERALLDYANYLLTNDEYKKGTQNFNNVEIQAG